MADSSVPRIIRFFITAPEGYSGQRAREFIFFNIAYWLGALSHASWTVLFALNGIGFMAWYNLGVSLVFLGAALSWRKFGNPVWIFIPLFVIEVPLHGMIGTVLCGIATLFWTVPLAAATGCLINTNYWWKTRVQLTVLMCVLSLIAGIGGLVYGSIAPLSQFSVVYLFVTNFIGILCAVIFYLGLNQYVVLVTEKQLTREFDRAEGLLRNILPDPIALRLKDGERVIANEHKEVSVIFADIVDFTAASAKLTPTELVETLNMVFSAFDVLAENHGAEKIKTIGDAYMVVLGVPDQQANHAEKAVELALEMQRVAADLEGQTHFPVKLRIGVNSGPVVAGVIGKRKFAYDLWGDAVNVASRMESHGTPGQILTTRATASLLSDRFAIRPEGVREVKGKGPTEVFSVTRAVG